MLGCLYCFVLIILPIPMFLDQAFRYSFVFFVIISILCLALDSASKLNIANTKWLKSNNDFEISRIELIEDFNETETLTISFALEGPFFDAKILNETSDFTNKLKKLDEVISITSPLNSSYLIKYQGDLHNVSLEYALHNKLISLDELPYLLKHSFYQDILFNANLDKINIVIEPDFDDNKPIIRARLLEHVENLIHESTLLKQDYYISGKTFLYHELDAKNKHNIYRLSIITLLLTLIFMVFIYRDKDRVIITALNSVIGLFLVFSLFNFFNINFSLLSLCLPVVIIIVTISDSIFVFNQYNHNQGFSYNMLVRKIWKPCFITSITTAFSFLAYSLSEIKPLNDLYILAPIVILLNYLWVVFVTPLCLIFLRGKRTDDPILLSSALKRIYAFAENAEIALVHKFLLCLIVISPSVLFIKVETNFLNIFFFKSEQIVKNIEKFDQDFIGSSDFSLIYQESPGNNFKEVGFFNKMTNNSDDLKSLSNINDIRSYQNIAQNALTELSDNKTIFSHDYELEQVLLFLEFSRNEKSHDVLADYINFDYTKGRVKLYTDNLSSSEISKASQNIDAIIDKENISDVKLVGTNAYFDGISKNLITTQFYSLLFVVLMGLCSIWLFYNLQIAVIASIANIAPLLSLAIICSVFRINFDFSFVLVTIICFGITIDCTIHMLHEYSAKSDLKSTLTKTGIAVSEISLFFIMCFAVFLLSDLLIFVKFAMLAVLAIALSYTVNIMLLPIAMRKYL
jgi:uncharacterized protein